MLYNYRGGGRQIEILPTAKQCRDFQWDPGVFIMGTLFRTPSHARRSNGYRRICLEELETRSLLSVNPVGVDDSPAVCEGTTVEPALPVLLDTAAEEKPDFYVLSVTAVDYYTGERLAIDGGAITAENLPNVTVTYVNGGDAPVAENYFYSAVRVRNTDTGEYILYDSTGRWYERYSPGDEEPGETGSFRFLIPKLAAGNYAIEVQLNSRGSVEESDYANDRREIRFSVGEPIPAKPDLAISSVTASDYYTGEALAIDGGEMTTDNLPEVTVTFVNRGNAAIDANYFYSAVRVRNTDTGAYVLKDAEGNWYERYCAGDEKPGETGSFRFLIPKLAAGNYTMEIRLNSRGTVEESDVSNDYAEYAFTVVRPAEEITDILLTDWVGVYDGKSHAITVTDPSAATDTILFSADGLTYDLTENPVYTDVGSYTTYVKVSRDGYTDWYGSAEVVIGEAPLPDYKINTLLAVTTTVPVESEVDTVPWVSEVTVGDTIYVSVYVKSTDSSYGVQGGYCALYYDPEGFIAGDYIASCLYPNETILDGYEFSKDDYISAFGGNPSGVQEAYGRTEWALVGTQAFVANAAGEYRFSNGPAVNDKGAEKESWSFVREDYPSMRDYGNSYDSVSLTVVEKSPYKIDTCVAVTTEYPLEAEVDAVPTVSEVSVGDTVYVSVYVKSTDSNYGISGGYCSLHYDPDAFTAGEYIASRLYPNETILDGFSYSGNDYISAFGGNPEGIKDVYGKTRWALVGTQTFTADAVGEYFFSSGMAINDKGVEKETWSFVREDFVFTREYANSYDSVALTVVEATAAQSTDLFADPDFVADLFFDF